MKKVSWILLAFFAIVISFQPLLYFVTDMSGGLLKSKSAELLEDLSWKIPFYIHMVSGGIALLTGWPQFSRSWRNKYLAFHRNLGKVYILSVMISGVTGLVVAVNASGGPVAQLGFLVLAVVWLYTTLKGFVSIKSLNIVDHQNWMIRSYAVCFAAVTLRLWIPFFLFLLGMEFLESYRIIAWLCWVPNLLVAEMMIRYKSKGKEKLVTA